MKTVVLYHAGCADGLTAAWITRGVLPADTTFLPVNYSDPPPDGLAGAEVYILDFSYKAPVIEIMRRDAARLCILDHHKTAQDELRSLPSCTLEEWRSGTGKLHIRFDMDKSGARLAWEHFYGGSGIPEPWIVRYTEDRDLWRWVLPNSPEVNAAIRSVPWRLEEWSELYLRGESASGFREIITEGRAILRAQQQVIDAAVQYAVEREVCGYRVPTVNATTLISEIGEQLAKGKPFAATFFIDGQNRRVWSLRSAPGGLNVAEIARQRGGGGHPHAAGFTE